MPYRTHGKGIYTTNSSGGGYTHGAAVIEKNVAGIALKQLSPSFDLTLTDQDVVANTEDFYLQDTGVAEVAGAFSVGTVLYVNSTTGLLQSDNVTDEVQALVVNATGGTFTLTYSGQTTSAIAWNASDTTLQTALEALSNIGVGDVTVAKPSAGNWTITFGGTLADTNVAQLTTGAGSLTGGASTAVVSTTTGGGTSTGVVLGTVVETSSTEPDRGVRSGYCRVDLDLKP
jgi:hypothetical protein